MSKRGIAEICHLQACGYLIYTQFTPLKENYPINDESTLHDAGCFFDISLEEMVLNADIGFEEMEHHPCKLEETVQ